MYKHWRGPVYPDKLPQRRWFEHYATLLDTVEIDNTFYRLPTEAAVEGWAAQTYVRFHGPNATEHVYQGRYGEQGLYGMAHQLGTWLDEGHDVYAYFNNDESGFAVQDARRLADRLRRR